MSPLPFRSMVPNEIGLPTGRKSLPPEMCSETVDSEDPVLRRWIDALRIERSSGPSRSAWSATSNVPSVAMTKLSRSIVPKPGTLTWAGAEPSACTLNLKHSGFAGEHERGVEVEPEEVDVGRS